MEIYDVNLSEEDRLHKFMRVWTFLICFAVVTTVSLILEWFDPMPATLGPRDHAATGLFRVMKCVLWSFVMSLYFSSKRFRLAVTEPWQAYQIIVEEDQIRTRNFNSYNWMLCKTVQRDHVRTIVEKEMGLLISSRDRVGTFLCGGIWIPKRLADYDYLKHLIASWKIE